MERYFYPRSPCGERLDKRCKFNRHNRISIHALLAESDTRRTYQQDEKLTFLSTLSLRRATTWARGSRVTYVISIHALLAESDHPQTSNHPHNTNFYPRSPCGERRKPHKLASKKLVFLSTLSLRRATCFRIPYWFKVTISIHALLAESDRAL